MPRLSKAIAVSVSAAVALGGCTLTPKTKPQPGPLPQQWTAAAAKPEAVSATAWWEAFADPTLQRLVAEGYEGNIPFQQALLRVTEARANARSTLAQYLPNLSAQAQAQYQRVLQGPPLVGSFQQFITGAGGGIPTIITEDQQFFGAFGPSVSWEVPLFGLLALAVRGAKLNKTIAAEEVRAAQVALVGDISQAYVDLRAAQNRWVVLQRSLQVAEQLAGVLESTVEIGFTAPVDAADARRQAEITRARLPDVAIAAYVARARLALLRGLAPGVEDPALDGALLAPAAVPTLVFPAAPAAPADLLRLRPDVARAERQALLAAVQVGVARHELLPKLTLAGDVNFARNIIGSPLPGQVGSLQVTPLLTVPLFDWGQRLAQAQVRKSQFEVALLDYRNVVNQAVAEADQALVELEQAQARLSAAQRAEASAERLGEGARQAYEAGFRSLRERLQVEQLLLEAQLTRIDAEASQAQASIATFRAFAGALEPATASRAAPTAS